MIKNEIERFIERTIEMQKISQRFRFKLTDDILKLDLGIPHIMVMDIISKSKLKPIISEIAEKLSISYPMMTHIIDKMEAKKLINRIRIPEDRRSIRVDLTRKGREIIRRCCEQHKKQTISFLKSLNKSDRNSLIKAVDGIYNVLTKYDKSDK